MAVFPARDSRFAVSAFPALTTVLIVFGVCLLVGCGITAPRSSEGYADLDSLGLADTDRVLALSIGPSLLRFVANHAEDDQATRELLRGLDGVRIRIYEIDGDAARVAARMEDMSRKLQAGGWQQVMQLRSEDERAHMLIKLVDQRICGMTVLVSDGDSEAVVINLMGELRPEQFADVMVALDVDAAGVQDIQPQERRES